ncbi:MAG: hypothetical protein ABI671_14135 [Burkholderiales bacterium]
MKIIQASFFWENDRPGGLGLSLRPPAFSPEDLTDLFAGETVRQYFRDSDTYLGTHLVETYFSQLAGLSQEAEQGQLPLAKVMVAALNIMYLTDRGFLANDEFNGPLFVYEK